MAHGDDDVDGDDDGTWRRYLLSEAADGPGYAAGESWRPTPEPDSAHEVDHACVRRLLAVVTGCWLRAAGWLLALADGVSVVPPAPQRTPAPPLGECRLAGCDG